VAERRSFGGLLGVAVNTGGASGGATEIPTGPQIGPRWWRRIALRVLLGTVRTTYRAGLRGFAQRIARAADALLRDPGTSQHPCLLAQPTGRLYSGYHPIDGLFYYRCDHPDPHCYGADAASSKTCPGFP
jgi:hypothetical protein